MTNSKRMDWEGIKTVFLSFLGVWTFTDFRADRALSVVLDV